MGDKLDAAVLACSAKYALHEDDGHEVASGEANVRLSHETLDVVPSSGLALVFDLREIAAMTAAEHRLNLELASGERLTLFHLGYKYDDFLRILTGLRHELALRDLLMYEKQVASDLTAKYAYTATGGRHETGFCQIRLYETALVVLPEQGDPRRFPYGYISNVGKEEYALAVEVEDDGRIVFSHLGPNLDFLEKSLLEAMNSLVLKTQHWLRDLGFDGPVIRRAARLLKDGRAVRRLDLESISPELWPQLEERLVTEDMAGKYRFLKALSRPDRISMGFKRGLMGDVTGEYAWFLMPIYSTDPAQPGNAVVMEASSNTESAKATYVFRMVGRAEYPQLCRDLGLLNQKADEFLLRINRCMAVINFRREPIFFPEERLKEPRYAHYRFAVRKLPELRDLRSHFVGRVLRHSEAQWSHDLMDLLRFNVLAPDDAARWRKTETEDEASQET